MTIDEFAAITQRVIARDGFDEFMPTACYPERRDIRTLAGLPADVEPEPAVLNWAMKHAKPNEEILIAFKSRPSEFTIVRKEGDERESQSFKVEVKRGRRRAKG